MENKIDTCVATWLWDIRHCTEMECTSMLLAKSILPSRPESTSTTEDSGSAILKLKIDERKINRPRNLQGRISAAQFEDREIWKNSERLHSSPTFWKSPKCTSTPIGQNSTVKMDNIESPLSPALPLLHSENREEEYKENRPAKRTDLSSNFDSVISEENAESPISSNFSNDPALNFGKRLFPEDSSSLDSACGSSPAHSSSQENSWCSQRIEVSQLKTQTIKSTFRAGIPFMPSYCYLRDRIANVLRAGSEMYSEFHPKNCRDTNVLLATISKFIEAAKYTGCVTFVDCQGFEEKVEQARLATENETHADLTEDAQRFALEVFCYLAKIIVRHLHESSTHDRLLHEALLHLTHLSLFGNSVCLEVVQTGGIGCLMRFCHQNRSVLTETVQMSLRALAVLCSVSKGCINLLSHGGLDLVLKLLCNSSFSVSVEAAGVLTQLTSPCHSFAALPTSLPQIIPRLLDLCDQCKTSESFFLCSAAIANLSLQHSSVSEHLYEQNAVLRLSRAYNSAVCESIYVQDQISTIFARLSANGYDDALIAQGAIQCLLSLLEIHDREKQTLCKRIRYKAALCLGAVAARTYGLKAIYESCGGYALTNVLRLECGQKNPVGRICYDLLTKLERKYPLESIV